MSATIAVGSAGKHTSTYIELRQVTADNRQLVAAVEDREREIHTALIRGCQDAMLIAQLRAENTAVKTVNEELRHKAVKAGSDLLRAKAEQERLRQAVINARPRIHQVPTELVRPFAPEVVLPYVSPVPYRSTANDETQQLPAIDRPDPAP